MAAAQTRAQQNMGMPRLTDSKHPPPGAGITVSVGSTLVTRCSAGARNILNVQLITGIIPYNGRCIGCHNTPVLLSGGELYTQTT